MNWMIARLSYPSFITLDIDECSNGSHVCDVNANCTKTGGSYNCTWKKGYTGDEDVAKVHVVTFITIFECILFNSYVSFGAFLCRNNRLMRKKIERLDFDVEVLGFVALFTGNRTSREHFSSDFQFFKLQKLVEHFIRNHISR